MDLICSSSDGDRMYAYFEVVYYEVRYINPKAKSKCAKQVNNDFDVRLFIYIYKYVYIYVSTYTRRVLYFGGRSLDTDPDFGGYWHFSVTIIAVCTNRNPYKRGTNP